MLEFKYRYSSWLETLANLIFDWRLPLGKYTILPLSRRATVVNFTWKLKHWCISHDLHLPSTLCWKSCLFCSKLELRERNLHWSYILETVNCLSNVDTKRLVLSLLIINVMIFRPSCNLIMWNTCQNTCHHTIGYNHRFHVHVNFSHPWCVCGLLLLLPLWVHKQVA